MLQILIIVNNSKSVIRRFLFSLIRVICTDFYTYYCIIIVCGNFYSNYSYRRVIKIKNKVIKLVHGSNTYYADMRVLIYCIILRLLGQQIKVSKLLHISGLKINCFYLYIITRVNV